MGQPLVQAVGTKAWMLMALVVTAIGGSLIKPSIVGTVARTTTKETKALGYSIYYTLVNIGGAVGPMLAMLVRRERGDLLRPRDVLAHEPRPRRSARSSSTRSRRGPTDAPPARSMAKVLGDMLHRLRQPALHDLPRDLLRLLGDVLARLLRPALLRAGLPEVRALRDHRDRGRVDDHPRDRPHHRARQEARSRSPPWCSASSSPPPAGSSWPASPPCR